MAHAILAPSSSERWLHCTRAPRLEQSVTDEGSDFALEGTIAHAVAECIHRSDNGKFNIFDKKLLQKEFGKDFDRFYGKEMLRHAEEFVIYCRENLPDRNYIFIERKLDITSHIQEGFGTIDFGAIYLRSDDEGKTWYWVLETFDLKYGKGVPVSAIENTQQMIYAIGVLNEYLHIFPIEKVIMHIYQPRIQNNSDWEISTEALLKWGEETLRPQAALAFAGEGEFAPGDHCTFCKVKYNCRALADYNMELAKFAFEIPALLSDEEILEIYSRENLFSGWLKSVNDYVLSSAVKGQEWAGYKLVHGRSNRVYTDVDKLSHELLRAGFSPHLLFKERALKGLEDLETSIGTEAFIKHVVPFVRKPPGAPTLAPASSTKAKFVKGASDFADDFVYTET